MILATSRLHTRACGLQKTIIALDLTRRDFRSCPFELYIKHWFIDVDDLIDYLLTNDDTSIILIVSNLLADISTYVLCPFLPQISDVFILGRPLRKNVDNKHQNQYILDVDYLLQTLVQMTTQNVITSKWLFSEQSMNDLTRDSAKYIWYQFFFDVLSHLSHTKIARNEMFKHVQAYHSSEFVGYARQTCEDFELNYKPQDIVRWYTHHWFIYKILHRSLRSENLNKIFALRYVISDLERSLNELRTKQSPMNYCTLYRGQQISLDEVKAITDQVGGLIGITAFWPATPSVQVAHYAAKSFYSERVSCEMIVFTIDIPVHLRHSPCVDISHLSHYPREQELIFPLRSFFRVEHINKSNHVWYADLTLVGENDDQFVRIMNPWAMIIGLRSFFSISIGHNQSFFRDLSQDNAAFLRFQLLIDTILRLDRNHFAKDEMLETCRAKFSLNPAELAKIDNFERTYVAKDAITWYTKDCFLYRLLNESLQIESIDLIVKLRYFIHDLHNQLAELQISFLRSFPPNQPIVTFYRGLTMTMLELNKFRENENNFVSTNSFLSTTRDFEAGLFFSGEGKVEQSHVSVIYEILVDTSIAQSVPFAAIECQSIFKDEDEVLFSMAAVFRIGQTEEISERLWKIQLTLTPSSAEQWNILTAHLER